MLLNSVSDFIGYAVESDFGSLRTLETSGEALQSLVSAESDLQRALF